MWRGGCRSSRRLATTAIPRATASWPNASPGSPAGLGRAARCPVRVLLSLENCGEFFELLFGCWAAGLCAVPANARLHPREVEYIAENSGARLLVATPGLADALAPLAGTVSTLAAIISTQTAEYDALVTNSEPV